MNIPMPPPEVYLAEYRYMPWGGVINRVVSEIVEQAPANPRLIDLMCGPGLLVQRLAQARHDVSAYGIDIDNRYIQYARQHCRPGTYFVGDVLTAPLGTGQFDVVVCTGALHHLRYEDQPRLLDRVFELLMPNGLFVLAEPCVAPYRTETERRLAAAELGYYYLCEVIRRDATAAVTAATCDILKRDVLLDGEYKTYADQIINWLHERFLRADVIHVWPDTEIETLYGDYIFICKKEV